MPASEREFVMLMDYWEACHQLHVVSKHHLSKKIRNLWSSKKIRNLWSTAYNNFTLFCGLLVSCLFDMVVYWGGRVSECSCLSLPT